MWAFIFILAMVPLFFFFTDDLGELFPQWAEHLPSSKEPQGASTLQVGDLGDDAAQASLGRFNQEPRQWYEGHTDTGAAAWVISDDGVYRLSVGCLEGKSAAVQVTTAVGGPGEGYLNYGYGTLELTQGTNISPDVIGAVAQFGQVQLVQGSSVKAQFQVPPSYSAIVGRTLSSRCQ